MRRPVEPKEEEAKPRKPAPFPFASKYIKRELRTDPHLARIFQSLIQVDIWEDFKRLRKALKVGEKHKEYPILMRAIDEAEDNCMTAHALWVNAKLLQGKFELDAQVIEAGMRKEAMKALQAAKKAGDWSKTITNADIDAQCAALYPDEWTRIQEEKKKHSLTIAHLDHLVTCWNQRCKTLNTMLGKRRA